MNKAIMIMKVIQDVTKVVVKLTDWLAEKI